MPVRNSCYVERGRFAPNTHQLIHEVVSANSGQILYRIPLMIVYEHEAPLDTGRFKDFVREPQEHRATIPMATKSLDALQDSFQRMVEWLAQHCDAPWSFEVTARSLGDFDVVFTFSDYVSGVAFKMLWR